MSLSTGLSVVSYFDAEIFFIDILVQQKPLQVIISFLAAICLKIIHSAI